MTELDKIKQLLQFNKFLEAEKLLQKLILNTPHNLEQLMLLAGLYRSIGKFNEAKKTYHRIIELDNAYTVAYRLLIDFLDENAESKSIQIEDFLATVFQHELDHLIGKLYIDRMKDIGTLMFEDEMIFENTEELLD